MPSASNDRLSPQQYLELRQRNWAKQRGIPLSDDLSAPIPAQFNQAILAAMGGEVSMVADAMGEEDGESFLPDYFPLHSRDGVLKPLLERAHALLTADELTLVSEVPVGIVHAPWLNAARLPVPAGGHIIEINYALFCGLNIGFREILWVMQAFFQPQFFSTANEFVQRYVQIFLPISRVIRHQFLYDTSVPFHFRKIDVPMSGLMAGSWSICAQLFVLLHEFGHVVLNHDDVYAPATDARPVEAQDLKDQKYRQEFEADAWAAEKIRDLPAGLPHPVSIEQMKTALSILFYIFEMATTLCPGEFNDETAHPRPVDRLRGITRIAFDLEPEALPQVDDLSRVHSAFEQVASILRDKVVVNPDQR